MGYESRKAYRLIQAYVRKIDFFFIIIYLRILYLRGSTPILRDRGFFIPKSFRIKQFVLRKG
jgi:hypothetical protein